MTKIAVFLFTSFYTFSALAYEVNFIGPCSSEPLFTTEVAWEQEQNVGRMSLDVLNDFQIPYQGTVEGLNQIFNTPIGREAMEIISDHEMLAYGWCYAVDGVVPELLAHEFKIGAEAKVVSWFYAFAHYKNGEWIAQCQKSFLRRSAQFCGLPKGE